MSSNLASYIYPGPLIPGCEPSSSVKLYRLTKLKHIIPRLFEAAGNEDVYLYGTHITISSLK